MRKESIICYLLIAVAVYFGLSKINLNIEIRNDSPKASICSCSSSLQDELLQEKFQAYQDWGYANGLAMAKRALGENEMFKAMGWDFQKDLTCEKVVDDMYKLGQGKAVRPD